jgi:hypothetical protein
MVTLIVCERTVVAPTGNTSGVENALATVALIGDTFVNKLADM